MVFSIAIPDPISPDPPYPYTRLNHFAHIISQDNDISSDVPHHVYASIYRELKRKQIDKDQLDVSTLNEIVNRLYGIRYRDHITHILSIITGREPLVFSRETQAKLKRMFQAILEPFEMFKPASFRRFMSYHYVAHQLCLLLDLPDHAKCFPLTDDMLDKRRHDDIWRPICAHLKWQFNPTVLPIEPLAL